MTETAGLGSIFYDRQIKVGFVGRAVNGSEVRIAKDGEILFKGPGVFHGYLINRNKLVKHYPMDGYTQETSVRLIIMVTLK